MKLRDYVLFALTLLYWGVIAYVLVLGVKIG